MASRSSSPSAYPPGHEADVALRDGSTIHVRPLRAEDGAAMRAFVDHVSDDSIGFRFFGRPSSDWIVRWSLDVDYEEMFALIAETGAPAQIVAHAVYVKEGPDRAEVAFLVADAWQGRGISTIMLAHLAGVAERRGIATFTAQVLPANHRMIDVFRDSGFPIELRSTPDAIAIELPTSLSEQALERFEERERVATVAAVRSILAPRSVAVIGASRDPDSIGAQLLHNLLSSGFRGTVYAVNHQAAAVPPLPAYPSVREVPEPVELAVVAVPAPVVLDVAAECAQAGVRALVVVSAGFGEVDEVGARRQRELLELCRDAGMRLVGPNCLGVFNTAPDVRLNATFGARPARSGHVGLISQSGGVGLAIIEAAERLGLGLSSFVSTGNKADISGNDLLRYWEQDAGTALAIMYLETFGNARKFARIAPRFARQKPLLAVKSGRSVASAPGTGSLTARLLAASDITVDALFQQAGVIRADTLHELFGVAALLSSQPVPRGQRVAIVTNGGGAGVMCTDACEAGGLDVAPLPAELRERLLSALPVGASAANPVDLTAAATPQAYRWALRTLIDAGVCDALIALVAPPLISDAGDIARAIYEVAASGTQVTIAAAFMTGEGPPRQLAGPDGEVPGYGFPEEPARAVALAARHGRWRLRPERQAAPAPAERAHEAAAVISAALARGESWLAAGEVAVLLDCYGLAVGGSGGGGPAGDGSGAGGLGGGSAAGDAVELIVGVASDPSFGPVLACAAGGDLSAAMGDLAVRITPIGELDAQEMVRSLHSFTRLEAAAAAVQDVLMRVSAMVETHREIAELDCSPVLAGPDGVTVLDARVRVEANVPPPLPSLRA